MIRISLSTILVAVALVGCREAPRKQQTTTAPQQQSPVDTPPTATQPATQPAATAPADPLHVRLHVRDVTDPQSAWLRIEALTAGASSAKAEGRWLRKNVLEINTTDADRVRIDFSELPVAAGRRIVLRLDQQGFDLASDIGPVVDFERGRAGMWTRVHDPE